MARARKHDIGIFVIWFIVAHLVGLLFVVLTLPLATATPASRKGQRFLIKKLDPYLAYEDLLVDIFDNASYPIFRRIVSYAELHFQIADVQPLGPTPYWPTAIQPLGPTPYWPTAIQPLGPDPHRPTEMMPLGPDPCTIPDIMPLGPIPDCITERLKPGRLLPVECCQPTQQELPLLTGHEARSRYLEARLSQERRDNEATVQEALRLFAAASPDIQAFVRYVLNEVEKSPKCHIDIQLGQFKPGAVIEPRTCDASCTERRSEMDISGIIEIYRPLLKGATIKTWGHRTTAQGDVDAILRGLDFTWTELVAYNPGSVETWVYEVNWC
jgi:hypothetical protein